MINEPMLFERVDNLITDGEFAQAIPLLTTILYSTKDSAIRQDCYSLLAYSYYQCSIYRKAIYFGLMSNKESKGKTILILQSLINLKDTDKAFEFLIRSQNLVPILKQKFMLEIFPDLKDFSNEMKIAYNNL